LAVICLRGHTGRSALWHADEVVEAGFGIRTGELYPEGSHAKRRQNLQFWQTKTRPVGRRFLPGGRKSRGLIVTVVPPVVLRLQGEPVAIAPFGRRAIALILKPVPNVSADSGRLFDFWIKDMANVL